MKSILGQFTNGISRMATEAGGVGKLVAEIIKIISAVPLVFMVMVVCAGVWVAAAGTFENIRFARTVDQVISLLSIAHDYAQHQPNFAQKMGEDVVATLGAAQQIVVEQDKVSARLTNRWGGAIRGFVPLPSMLRIEVDMPTRNCRRMAHFFIEDVQNIGLQEMAAQSKDTMWIPLNIGVGDAAEQERQIAEACGREANATLAMVFRLR